MREVNKIAEALFEKIRSRFEDVSLGDENAKNTTDPEQARFFNFDYQDQEGNNYGNITLSLIDEYGLKVYFSKNISENMDEDKRQEWYSFLRELRYFAKRNLLTFDTRDINRSNLNIKDLKQVSKSDSTYDTDEIKVNESRLYGTTKMSFENIGEARLIVRHNESINPEQRGSRARHIESIFVENAYGERFRVPENRLIVARALARHISEGGNPYDDVGNYMLNVIKEMNELGRFVRNMRHRVFEDGETQGMVDAATSRYYELHEHLTSLRTSRGYARFSENFEYTEDEDTDADVEQLKERFSRRVFDDRLMDSLNYVHRAYKRQTESRQRQLESIKGVVSKTTQLIMSENDLQDQYMESLRFADNTTLVTKILEDIAERVVDMPEVKQFALRWVSQFGNVNETASDTVQEERALAVQLATSYLRDLKSIKENSELKSQLRDPVEEADYLHISDIDMLGESAWALPDTEEKMQELKDLLANPLPVGVDATNATTALGNLLGDDVLFDRLQEISQIEGGDADARPAINRFLKEKMPAIYDAVIGMENPNAEMDAAPAPPAQPQPNPADAGQVPPVAPQQAQTPPMAEGLDDLKRLAGLAK
jgi:hypothetical protein